MTSRAGRTVASYTIGVDLGSESGRAMIVDVTEALRARMRRDGHEVVVYP
jgi:ribulose kinase